MLQCCLPRSEHKQHWALLVGCVTGQPSSGFPFVVRNSFQALPHLTSVRAGVVGFNLNPVLVLCLFDGSSQGIGGFLINIRSLKAADLAFSTMRMLPVIHGFWLGYVRTVTVGTTSSMHLLMKLRWCIPQCHWMNPGTCSSLCWQNSSFASASSDNFFYRPSHWCFLL